MRRVMILGLVALLGAMTVFAGEYPAPVKKELYANDVRGKAAPELVVEQWLTAKPETKGKVVLVDFWATWCPPCREAIPELNALQKKFKDDLVVIGISKEDPEVVKEFMKKTEFDYAVGIDSKNVAATKIGVRGIPHVLIISTDGVVRWQGFPFSEEEKLTAEIVQKVIDADPGVAARRAGEKK
ncbi:MAG: TlpA family protein disulfide reductase [Phycisphaerae bacterium]